MNAFKDVKANANGRWHNTLPLLAPQLIPAINSAPKHVPCPIHGGKDGFRLFQDSNETGGGICNTCGNFSDGFSLLAKINDWSLTETLNQVDSTFGKHNPLPASPITQTVKVGRNQREAEWNKGNIDQVFGELITLGDPDAAPVFNYLNNRGVYESLLIVPEDILCHPNLPYFLDGKIIGNMPAVVSIVRNINGEIISLHRTYITSKGDKADVPVVRKLMPPSVVGALNGCAIQLFPATDTLILAEGIETALALHIELELPVWACLSANGLERVMIPETVRNVIIGADNDASLTGQKAAIKLAERLLEEDPIRVVKIITPKEVGTDWLDAYLKVEASI